MLEFNREPVVIFQGLVVPVLMAASLVFGLSTSTQGYVDAALTALGGFVAAAGVSIRAALPLLTGLIKAVIALVLALGVHLPSAWQIAAIGISSAVVAFFVQSQVTPTAKSVHAEAA